MSATEGASHRARQAAGTPVGGQFATEARTEPTVSLATAGAARLARPVTATFHLQRADQWRGYVDAGTVQIDVTDVLAAMSVEDRRRAAGAANYGEDLWDELRRRGRTDHDGPYVLAGLWSGGSDLHSLDPDDPDDAAVLGWLDATQEQAPGNDLGRARARLDEIDERLAEYERLVRERERLALDVTAAAARHHFPGATIIEMERPNDYWQVSRVAGDRDYGWPRRTDDDRTADQERIEEEIVASLPERLGRATTVPGVRSVHGDSGSGDDWFTIDLTTYRSLEA